MLSQLLHFTEDLSTLRAIGYKALAELNRNGGFQPPMATDPKSALGGQRNKDAPSLSRLLRQRACLSAVEARGYTTPNSPVIPTPSKARAEGPHDRQQHPCSREAFSRKFVPGHGFIQTLIRIRARLQPCRSVTDRDPRAHRAQPR
jgi:hypothetical protein